MKVSKSKFKNFVRIYHSQFANELIDFQSFLYNLKQLEKWDVIDATAEAQNAEQTKLTLSAGEESDFKVTENGEVLINTKKAIQK